jgi:cation:H+ antiporter
MVLMFLGAMYLIYSVERSNGSATNHQGEQYRSARLSRAVLFYIASAITIVAAAIWLARIGDSIAHAMGWEASFVGTQFLAFSTSLPELAASFAAIRIHAPELAITNVLGSNLFNMGFILFLDDVALAGQPLWSAISPVHGLTAVVAILMTAVVIVALAMQLRNRPGKFWTVEGVLLIGLYLTASILVSTLVDIDATLLLPATTYPHQR